MLHDVWREIVALAPVLFTFGVIALAAALYAYSIRKEPKEPNE